MARIYWGLMVPTGVLLLLVRGIPVLPEVYQCSSKVYFCWVGSIDCWLGSIDCWVVIHEWGM